MKRDKIDRYRGTFQDNLSDLLDAKTKPKRGEYDYITVSQNQVAKEIGVSNATLSSWKSGEKVPNGESLLRLALYFDVSIDWLFGLSESKSLEPEIGAACAATGVSSKTISAIHNFVETTDTTNGGFLLELLFCNRNFVQFLRDLGELYDAHSLFELYRYAENILGNDVFADEEAVAKEAAFVVSKFLMEKKPKNHIGINRQKAIEWSMHMLRDPSFREETGICKEVTCIDLAKHAVMESFFRLMADAKDERLAFQEIANLRQMIIADKGLEG